MGDLLIRNVPEDLKRDLGEIARNTGRSMSDAAKDMIRTGVERYQSIPASAGKNAYEQLREVFAPFDEGAEEFANIMDELEEQRKKDFGRPFSFEE
jgi:plasmid stability protein